MGVDAQRGRVTILARSPRMSVPTTLLDPEVCAAFSDDARRAVYECIALRRDIRHFRPGVAIDPAVLTPHFGRRAPSTERRLLATLGFRRDPRRRRARARSPQLSSLSRGRSQPFPGGAARRNISRTSSRASARPRSICASRSIYATAAKPSWARPCSPKPFARAPAVRSRTCGWPRAPRASAWAGSASWSPRCCAKSSACPRAWSQLLTCVSGTPSRFGVGRCSKRRAGDPRCRSTTRSIGTAAGRSPRPQRHALARGSSAEPRNAPFVPASAQARAAALAHSATLTKPVGSLGRLEELAAFYAGARGVFPPPALTRATLALFLADHGVAVEAVSAFGSQITAAMAGNVMSGGAAVSAIAADCRVDIVLTDVGIAGDLSSLPTRPLVELHRRRVRAGTGNLAREPAMTLAEAESALAVGAETARAAIAAGSDALALGEIGIANTTAAAALVSVFTGLAPAKITGRGTGVADAVLARKIAVIETALALHRPDSSQPLAVLAALGGLEIAALVGCMTKPRGTGCRSSWTAW